MEIPALAYALYITSSTLLPLWSSLGNSIYTPPFLQYYWEHIQLGIYWLSNPLPSAVSQNHLEEMVLQVHVLHVYEYVHIIYVRMLMHIIKKQPSITSPVNLYTGQLTHLLLSKPATIEDKA